MFGNKKVVAALVIPGIVIMFFAIAAPLIISIFLSFMKWSGFGKMKFIGLSNYVRLLTKDPLFWRSIYNVLLLTIVTICFQNVLAFLLASVLVHLTEGVSRLLRTIYFIPATLSLVVVTKLWVHIFHPEYGLLNKMLIKMGLQHLTHAWLGDPSTAIWAVIWIMIWQGFGWALLFFYSGLVTVPQELEEAAKVDGANKWQLYVHVIIPYMMPVIEAIVVIDVISSLKQMEMVYLSTEGGPGNTTQFIAQYLYQRAFKYGEYGYGNAISVIFVILAVALTILIQRSFRKAAAD
ncbi:MAG: sugar ABC transporter permease [Treponema sp.]|jgi:raffinose/stachyose/melibiose transport system permease protein|nr:sugar ABC transporter permease [Treponema sp.]